VIAVTLYSNHRTEIHPGIFDRAKSKLVDLLDPLVPGLPSGAKAGSCKAVNETGDVLINLNNFGLFVVRYQSAGSGPATEIGPDAGILGVAINNRGLVVGQLAPSTARPRAFRCQVGGLPQDLNDFIPAGSGWVLTYACAVNDQGQIIGEGTFNGEPAHAFLLTPIL
jgi:hypothetical protein